MDCSPSGSSVLGDSPGKNTAVGCHALLQRSFPTQGWNPHLLSHPLNASCIGKWGLYHEHHLGMKDFISTVSCTSRFWWSLHLCTSASSIPWAIMSIWSPQIQGTWLLLLPWAEQESCLPGICTCNSSELSWAEELSSAKHREPCLSRALLQSPASFAQMR